MPICPVRALGAFLLPLWLALPSPGATRVALFPFHSSDPASQPALVELTTRLENQLRRRNTFQILPPEHAREAAGRLPAGDFGPSPELAHQTGRSLAVDWIVLGTLAATASGTNLWTSVIDIDSSMVTDVSVIAWNPKQIEMLASFERALALDPNDQEAKFWVGYGNVFSSDPAEAHRGRQLLQDVSQGPRPDLAERARRALSLADQTLTRPGSTSSPSP